MPVDKKKIAKNTVFLYVRMIVILLCNLYLVRIVMEALGVTDYGINNIVGGIVSMFTFFTSTLSSSSQRFFSYKIGEKDKCGLSDYFSTSLLGYIFVALIVLILGETLGLWFVQNKLNIPMPRMDAALWVYQCALVTFLLGLLAIPFSSLIIAYEKMNVFAYIGIIEALLRLVSAYLLFYFPFDRLKVYAVLFCVATSAPSLYYIFSTSVIYREARLKKHFEYRIFKEIFSFSGWTFLGAISSVIRSQGINILLNMFFGPVINAARGVAFQINAALNQFVLNFFKAVQPQIIKSYAANEYEQTYSLIYKSSKICFFLILLIALPIYFNMPFILSLWLTSVPDYTIQFSRLVIVTAVIESTMYPLQTALMAEGNIKWYQITTSFIMLLNFPLAFILLRKGYSPESVFYLAIVLAVFAQLSRLYYVKKQIKMSIKKYFLSVFLPSFFVTILSPIPPFLIKNLLDEEFILSSFILLALCALSVVFFAFTIGLNHEERIAIKRIIKQKIKR